jgi:hypothetical protein
MTLVHFRVVFTLNLLDAISSHDFAFTLLSAWALFCVCAHIIENLFSFFPPLNLISRRYYHYYYYIVARPLFLFAHISRFHDRLAQSCLVFFCVCERSAFFSDCYDWRCHQLPLSLCWRYFVWDVTRIGRHPITLSVSLLVLFCCYTVVVLRIKLDADPIVLLNIRRSLTMIGTDGFQSAGKKLTHTHTPPLLHLVSLYDDVHVIMWTTSQ